MPSLDSAQMREMRSQVNARLRREFGRRNFTIPNYRPPTGIGLFDFKFQPLTRQIEVRVNATYNFLGPTHNGEYLPWTELEKSNYKTKAASVIHNAWSGRYRMVCKDPDWSDLSASVDIRLVETPPSSAHYIIDARKVTESQSTAWSGGCSHGATVWPYTANFSNWGVETRIDLLGDRVFNLKEKQLTERLHVRGVEFVPMAHGGSTISPDYLDRLYKFARDAKQILGTDVTGIQCSIYGCSTERMGSKRAHERADAVGRLLKGELPAFFVVDRSTASKRRAEEVARGKGMKLDGLSGVVLHIYVPPHSLRRVNTNYIIITHEFGHMLGCPDEYTGVNCTGISNLMQLDELVPAVLAGAKVKNVMPLSPGQHFTTERSTPDAPDNVARLQKQQTAFAGQLEQSGVKAPAYFAQDNALNGLEMQAATDKWYADRAAIKQKHGPDSKQYKQFNATSAVVASIAGASDSIMYAGQKIHAAHYLPIWSALTTTTREFVDPSAWAIEPV